MDITSDVEVLENMLKKDGLSDEGGITMTLWGGSCVPKKETIAFLCLFGGTVFGGFAKLYVIAVVFYLIALAIDIPLLVEEYQKWKRKKRQ